LDIVEPFLQIKSLFLLLQVLFDLRQAEPASPILFLLEVKLTEIRYIRQQKQLIKNQQHPKAG
jgi:hypothetical protein